jgi:hypothetical protein
MSWDDGASHLVVVLELARKGTNFHGGRCDGVRHAALVRYLLGAFWLWQLVWKVVVVALGCVLSPSGENGGAPRLSFRGKQDGASNSTERKLCPTPIGVDNVNTYKCRLPY